MVRPNRLTIPAGGSQRVTVEGVALVQPLGVPVRTILAYPTEKDPSSPTAPTDVFRSGIDLVLTGAGVWILYNTSAVGPIDVLILDFSCCCELVIFFSRGGFVVATNTFATVGVASAEALAANVNRRCATFVNDSANTIYLAFGAAAVVGSGIRLNANGGSFTMQAGDALFTLLDVRAIAGGAGSNLCIVEGS